MKTIQLLFVLHLTICIGVLCSAQQKRWTIEECVSHALKNNISIKQSELDIKSNGLDKLAAIGNFLPSVNFGGTHSWNIGLNQNITTGLLENQTTQFTSASLSSNITIYNGLQNINRLHRTKLAQLAAQYQLTKMQDDISLFVANAFLDILFNKENLKVQQLQLANDQKQLVRAQELVDAGSVPRGDLFDMKATIASDNQKVIIAENALLLSKLSLAQALQLQDFENFDIADVAVEANLSPLMAEKSESIVDKAKQVRSEIKIAKTNLDVALRDIEIAKGAYKPSLTGFYSFSTRASYSNRIVGIDPSGVPILASPLPLFDQFSDNKGHNFGLQISIPVLNGLGVKTNVARSKLNYERSKIALNQANLDLEANVYKAISDAKGALKTYESSITTLEARQEAFNYAKERFNVGMMNAFDFNQAQTLLTNAQSEVIRTKYDYIFKIKILEFYFGVFIQPHF